MQELVTGYELTNIFSCHEEYGIGIILGPHGLIEGSETIRIKQTESNVQNVQQ